MFSLPGCNGECRYVIPATLGEVSRATEAVRTVIAPRLTPEECYAIEIGISEVLTNIVKHGYSDMEGCSITLCLCTNERELLVEVQDTGKSIPPAILARSVEEVLNFDLQNLTTLPESGLGLALARLAFDELTYQSNNGVNSLRLQKRLRAP